MIQRIQTLYLLLTTIVSGLFLKWGFLTIINSEGSQTILKFKGFFRAAVENGIGGMDKLLPLTVISVLIPAISLVAIFIFKNRKLQMKLTLVILVLEVVLLIAAISLSLMAIRTLSFSITTNINALFPFLSIIFTILAFRRIKKDDDLVKSYDRIR